MRKKLIKVDDWDTFFHERIYNRCFRNEYEQGYTDALDRVDDWMDEQPTVEGWIPVTERLPHFFPEKRRKVLVTLEDNSGKRFTTTAKYHEDYEYWYEWADCRYAEFKVIAWMEKPAPYEPPKEVE